MRVLMAFATLYLFANFSINDRWELIPATVEFRNGIEDQVVLKYKKGWWDSRNDIYLITDYFRLEDGSKLSADDVISVSFQSSGNSFYYASIPDRHIVPCHNFEARRDEFNFYRVKVDGPIRVLEETFSSPLASSSQTTNYTIGHRLYIQRTGRTVICITQLKGPLVKELKLYFGDCEAVKSRAKKLVMAENFLEQLVGIYNANCAE